MPRHVVLKSAVAVFCLFWLLTVGRAAADDLPVPIAPPAQSTPSDPAAPPAQAPAAPTDPGAPDTATAPASPAETVDKPAGEQAADGPPKVGELVEAKGEVRARRGQEPERRLPPGAAVYVNDALATGKEDKGKVAFADGSSLEIGPDSSVLVADFAYDAAKADSSRQAIRMAKGLFRYVSGKVVEQDPAHLRLESPLAVIGIRGTTMDHKIVLETKTVKGVSTEVVKEELHALRATKHSQVVVDQHGLKSLLSKTDQAAFLRPKLPGSVRALTEKERQDFANIPLTPAPFDPRPGRGGMMGGGI
ncbi:MAG: FecR domain-containing protein [Solidesulfovibrio sp.]